MFHVFKRMGELRHHVRLLLCISKEFSTINLKTICPVLRVEGPRFRHERLCFYWGSRKRTFTSCLGQDVKRTSKVQKVLQDLFHCSEEEASDIERSVTDLPDSFYENAKLLRNQGLSKDSLIAYPKLLEFSSSKLNWAVSSLKRFHSDINVSVHLVHIPLHILARLSVIAQQDAYVLKEGNRINIVSNALECEPSMVSRSFAKYRFMLSISLARLMAVSDILKEANMIPETVLKDMWIFKHNIETMEKRIEELRNAGILPVKPWSLRCDEDVFRRMVRKKVALLEVLGRDTSLEDYLSKKLDCHLDEVSYVHSKTPQVGRSSCPRINKLLDYLYSEGFTPDDVRRMPRILTRSLETVRSRLTELREMGFRVVSLGVVCKTRREYKELITRLNHNRLSRRSALKRK